MGGSVELSDQSNWACSAALWLEEAELKQHRLVVLLWNRRSTKLGCVCVYMCVSASVYVCVCVSNTVWIRVLPQREFKVKQPQESILVGYTAVYKEETYSYHTYGMYLGSICPACGLFCNSVCVWKCFLFDWHLSKHFDSPVGAELSKCFFQSSSVVIW